LSHQVQPPQVFRLRSGPDKTIVEQRVGRMEESCRHMRLPMTQTRRVIVRVLAEMEDHPDAHEIMHRVSAIIPGISPATIYRTLAIFEQAGVLHRREFGRGRARYENADKSHHHMVDRDSGDITDFRSQALDEVVRKIARDMGYELVDYSLFLYGDARE